MAADPHRSNQPLVNGQNGSSKGNSDREPVGAEKGQDIPSYPQHPQVGPQLSWPRQQRPPDPRGFVPQVGNRPPPHQGIRRVSPWAVLRTKLPEQQPVRVPGSEHSIFRMQNPEEFGRPRPSPDINGFSRPPLNMSRPPSGQLSKPPSLEGPTPPPGTTPPRSPFLQRADSRAGSPMYPPPLGGASPMNPGMMMGGPPGGMINAPNSASVMGPGAISSRPPSLSSRPPSVSRSFKDDDDDEIPPSNSPFASRPSSAARFPSPNLVRTPSAGSGNLPSRPPSRTGPTPPPPTTAPLTATTSPRTTPLPGRQPSVNSLPEQNDPKVDNPADTETSKSATPSPRPLSAATSQESDSPPQPPPQIKPTPKIEKKPELKPEPTVEPANKPEIKIEKPPLPLSADESTKNSSTKSSTIKIDDVPKRPNQLETTKRENSEALRDASGPQSSDAPSSSEDIKQKEAVVNGSHDSPKKLPPKGSAPKKLGTVPSAAKSPSKSLPKTPETPGTSEKKKLPMNKVQVGAAPSPNLKVVKSKIGSLQNAHHKPGGGHIKIETRKLEFRAGARIEAKNDAYSPGGGEKKIQQVKLQWNAKSKIGSLENAQHKPGGGDKKIESVKLDFKDKAKSKVGSKDNIKHTPGGGQVKIEDQKLDIKAQSRIGSMDNVKHRPGGGDIKIFDDKEYMKQMMGSNSDVHSASNQGRRTSRSSSSSRTRLSGSKSGTRENLTDDLSPEKPPSKPLAKPTDQNSNQLNSKTSSETKSQDPSSTEQSSKDDIKKDTNGNGKKPLDEPQSSGNDMKPVQPNPPNGETSSSPLPTNPFKSDATPIVNPPLKDDFHAVIEKSQTEMTEKELAKPYDI